MKLIAFNKPYQVLSQFTSDAGKATLADHLQIPEIYCAGRLDYDSEGLLLLTDNGGLQHQLSHPRFATQKTYWAQVEGLVGQPEIDRLLAGVELNDGFAKAHSARLVDPPDPLWPRKPPIRKRKNKPTSWLEIGLLEGRNRQVRRMTANVGYPTLRLIRHRIGEIELAELQPGAWREEDVSRFSETQSKVLAKKPRAKTPLNKTSRSKKS